MPPEGANCADLPSFVVDKYFFCNVQREPFLAQTARAICARCVVVEQCRQEALTMPYLQASGVIGGVAASDIRRARAWRRYELGLSTAVPNKPRPAWLARSDAAEIAEQVRIESDPDEIGS